MARNRKWVSHRGLYRGRGVAGRGVLALSLQDPGPGFPPEPGQPDPLSFWRSLKYFAIGYDVSHFLAQSRVNGLTGSCEI